MLETRKFPTLVFSLLVGIVAMVMMVPIILTITNSLMTEREMGFNYDLIGKMTDASAKDAFVNLKLIPDWITLDQYVKLLITTPKFLQMFWNSVGLVIPIVAGQVLVATLAAYAYARLRFRGRDTLFMIYLMTMLMPFQVTLVPNYIMIDKLGLMNTPFAIILPGIFGAFGVFMVRQFMANLPNAYTEAGKMDGAG
ncbi:carbohydrate ABC transporter permease, partial [Paenibacillus sp. TAF58]